MNLKLLSSEILRDKVRRIKEIGEVKQLAQRAECTAAFIYWWLEDTERDMRLELACRIYNEAIGIIQKHENQAMRRIGENHD